MTLKHFYLIFLLIISSLSIKAQNNSADTILNNNGEIQYVLFENLYFQDYISKRYFKESKNTLDINKPIIDSLFCNEEFIKNNECLTFIHLPNNSKVFIQKFKDCNEPNSTKINYYFPNIYDGIGVGISLNKDSSILKHSVSQIGNDSLEFKCKKTFYNQHYLNANFDTDTTIGASIVYIPENGYIEMTFNELNLLSGIYFYPKDTILLGIYYTFYENSFCKNYGNFIGLKTKYGIVTKYYDNGNILSIGKYNIHKNSSHVFENIKENEWLYYDAKGNLIKKEIYKDGKLEETIIIE